MINPTEGLYWRRSRQCSAGSCVEVAATGEAILVRDSKNLDVPPLAFTRAEWEAFVAGVKAGDFGFG
jgi:predicted secreted Zn-dependent protease